MPRLQRGNDRKDDLLSGDGAKEAIVENDPIAHSGVEDLELVKVSDETGPLCLSQFRGSPDEQDAKVLSDGRGIAITWKLMGMNRGLRGVSSNSGDIANSLAGEKERSAEAEDVIIVKAYYANFAISGRLSALFSQNR
jgi:hypothetical protein